MKAWLVTIRRDEHHTYDHLINARSAYSAGWIVRQIKPGARIIAIRPAHKSPGGIPPQARVEQSPLPL